MTFSETYLLCYNMHSEVFSGELKPLSAFLYPGFLLYLFTGAIRAHTKPKPVTLCSDGFFFNSAAH